MSKFFWALTRAEYLMQRDEVARKPRVPIRASCTKVTEACGRYIEFLENQSPIVSTSHHHLRGLYDAYGVVRVDAEIERQFKDKKS